MSKAPEDNGGVTDQTPECTCGFAQKGKLDRHPSAPTGRRSSLDGQKSGGLQSNSASGASSSRAAPAAASPPLQGARSLKDSGRSGDVKSAVQAERKSRERAKSGDLQQPKSPLGTGSPCAHETRGLRDEQQGGTVPSVDVSPCFQWESSLRDSRRSGDGQQPKSPSGNALPAPFCHHQGERGSRGSRSSDLQKVKTSSVDASAAVQEGTSLRNNRRSGDEQQAKSPSVDGCPTCQREGSSRDNRRSGNVHLAKSSSFDAPPSLQKAKSLTDRHLRDSGGSGDVQLSNSSPVNGAPSFQGEESLRDNRRNGSEQQAKSPSVDVCPSCQGQRSSKDNRTSGNGHLAKSPSVDPSPSLQKAKSLTERTLRDSGRSGHVQLPNSSPVSAAPAFQEEGSFKDNRRGGDEQQHKSPAVNGCPSCRGQGSSKDNRRSENVHLSKPPSVDPSPSLEQGKSPTDRNLRDRGRSGDVQLPNSSPVKTAPSFQGEGGLRDNRRIGDGQQQSTSPSIDVTPSSFQRVRNLRDSIKIRDVPSFISPSLASSSRASPSTTSPSILRWGSTHANSAPAVSPSRTPPTAPPSTCPSLKSKLAAGHKLYGAFLVTFSTVVAEILGWAGYDFVVVDFEQLFPGDTFAALPVLQALESTGTPAIFRLPGDDPVLVNKALDMGPAGLMFSMIEDEDAARNAVASCRFPPRGTRRGSRYMVSRASCYGLDSSYLDRCEEELLVMCQVETTKAVDHIMEIAKVEGVDCIQMGGLDFGASLGDPYLDYNKEKILARQRKVLLAGFATPESSPDTLFKRGYHLVSGAVDVVLLRNAALADLQRNKPSLNT